MVSGTDIEMEAGAALRPVPVQFYGTFTNKLDSKGRLSVPSDFRRMLADANPDFDGFICVRSMTRPVLDCGGEGVIDELLGAVSTIDEFDEDRLMLEEGLMASAQRLFFDDTGRVVMPGDLRDFLGLTSHATFVGRKGTFQIWHPDLHAERLKKLQAAVARHGETMTARQLPSGAGRKGARP